MIDVLPMLAGAVGGSVVGSFVALVADRWPRGEDMVMAPSACRGCGRRLGPAQLVPVASYCLQRGRCVWCGTRLPGDLLLAELAGAAIAGLAVLRGADAGASFPASLVAMAALAGFGSALLLLALLDARHLWLPDAITLPLLLAGLLAGLVSLPAGGAILPEPTLANRVVGAALGYALLEGLRRAYRRWRGREGLGGGDPKLLGAIGAWLGGTALPGIVFIAACAGLGWVGLERLRGRPAGGLVPVPLGTALAASALVWLAAVGVGGGY